MIGAMIPLAAKLRGELTPGAVIVSNAFALRGWEPDAVIPVADTGATRVYRYRAGQTVACSPESDRDSDSDQGEDA